jgi:hypothetical protein
VANLLVQQPDILSCCCGEFAVRDSPREVLADGQARVVEIVETFANA